MKKIEEIKGVYNVFSDIETSKKVGIAEIKKRFISEEEASFANIRFQIDKNYLFLVNSGEYVVLKMDGFGVMMSDTQLERRSNIDFINKANGRVMIAGLGIGFIIENIRDKIESGEVTEVVIYEKYKDVIDLVSPYYNDLNIKIIHKDIFEHKPEKNEIYDCIYFDIWESVCTDNLKEMEFLHRRWGKNLNKENPNKFIDSWLKKYLQKEKRKEFY